MGFAVPLAVQENSRGLFVSDTQNKANLDQYVTIQSNLSLETT